MHHKHFGRRHGGHDQERRFARGPFGHDPLGERGRGHGGPGRHGRGGRDGLSRLFAHGDLRLVILSLIAEKPSHGYELIKGIEERAGGAYSPSPGVIYPTLTLLEETGHVTVSASDGAKKLYAVTDEGRAFLAESQASVQMLFAKMEEAGRRHGRGMAPQVERALENFKLALRMRLSRGPLNEAEADALVAVLDEAARAVERS